MSRTALHALALVFILLTAVEIAVVSMQLGDGAAELGRHWWSTLLTAVPVLVAAVLFAAARRR